MDPTKGTEGLKKTKLDGKSKTKKDNAKPKYKFKKQARK